MEEKKKRNIFSIIALALMFLTIVFVYFGLMKANIVFVILSIICEISVLVLAIIGIVKANKLKKDIGKRKGIIFCIISIVVIIIISAISFMELVILINEIITGDTEFSTYVKSTNLTEDEKIIGQCIKTIQNNSGIGEFIVNDIKVYKRDGGFEAFIDYTFTSVAIGQKKDRHKILLHHIYSEANTQNPNSSIYEYGGNIYELISKTTYMMEKIDINKTKILEYSKDKNTKTLNIN